jgi:hypothetical protein
VGAAEEEEEEEEAPTAGVERRVSSISISRSLEALFPTDRLRFLSAVMRVFTV